MTVPTGLDVTSGDILPQYTTPFDTTHLIAQITNQVTNQVVQQLQASGVVHSSHPTLV